MADPRPAGLLWRPLKVAQMLHVPSAALLLALVSVPVLRNSSDVAYALLKGIPVLLAAMGCFAVNDAFDFEQDIVNKPYRAIPSGAISRRDALALGVVLELSAALLAFPASSNASELALYLAIVAGSGAYSPLLRALGPLKGLYTAAFIVLPFAISLRYAAAGIAEWAFLSAVVAYCAAKEFQMDLWDEGGDRLAGMRTLPVLAGPGITWAVVVSLQLAAVAFMAMSGIGWAWAALSALAVALVDVLPLLCGGRGRRMSVYLSWLPLVFMAIPVFAG